MEKKYDENPNTPEKLKWLYTERYSPESERLSEWMIPYLFKFIGEQSNFSVLDVGCGFGRLLNTIRKNFKDVECVGIEISPDAVEQAKKYYEGIEFVEGNFEYSDIKNAFDLVICSQTLEHVDNPDVMIEKLKLSVKPGGKLFITVPVPKSNLDNGVKTHYWRFYPNDFHKRLKPFCNVYYHETRMIIEWKKPISLTQNK